MADLFDILNVNPAQSVQPQSLMQTIAGRMDRNIQQAAGNDVRDSQAKMQAASEGVDLNSSKGLLEFSQRLQNLGMTQQAMGVVQLAQQKRALETQEIKQAEQDAQRTAVSSFITNKWPELANVAPSMTIPQAQAYDAAKKAGEVSEFMEIWADKLIAEGHPDLSAAFLAGDANLFQVSNEANRRDQVPQPTTNQLKTSEAAIRDAFEISGWEWLPKGQKRMSSEEITALATEAYTISVKQDISVSAAAAQLASEGVAKTPPPPPPPETIPPETTTLATPNLNDVVID